MSRFIWVMAEEKAALRAQIRARMAAMSEEERRRSDDALFARFLALPQVEKAGTILLYLGMGAEPDTAQLLSALSAKGKTVALPRILPERGMEGRIVTQADSLIRHPYGMLEPGEDCPVLPKEKIDLILAPGLAFDRCCYRLGQGGGYYDRYLSGFTGHTVALCRRQFLLEHLNTEVHDRPVDMVLTEEIVCLREPFSG